jgi:putative nucleotidyltransferase with HDIG domain
MTFESNVLARQEMGEGTATFELSRERRDRESAEEELKRTIEKLRKIAGATIHAMARAVEVRDPYTAGHQKRVSTLAWAVANSLGLCPDQIDGIRMAGHIHDIGKIALPQEILSKPGALTDIEFSLIKEHPEVGFNILKDVEFPWDIAQIVLQHHERLNGTGYPHGLSGDHILLEARILAVADVVEAMASHRPYRPALGLDKAVDEILSKKGRLYDPRVVEGCLSVVEKWSSENKGH